MDCFFPDFPSLGRGLFVRTEKTNRAFEYYQKPIARYLPILPGNISSCDSSKEGGGVVGLLFWASSYVGRNISSA